MVDSALEAMIPTPDETKAGWNPERLTAYFRRSCPTDIEFFNEAALRARQRAASVAAEIAGVEEMETSPASKKHLRALEQDLDAARAQIKHATKKLREAG